MPRGESSAEVTGTPSCQPSQPRPQAAVCWAGLGWAGLGWLAGLHLSLSNTADYQPSPRRAALLPAQLQLPAAGLLSPPRPELPRAQQLRAGPQLRSSGASRNVGAASAGRCRPRLGSGSRLPASRSPDTLHPPGAGR